MSTKSNQPESSGYHHGDLRNALLKAVGEIVDDKGIGGVSLREAARRAGVSHGAPAHHFGDKLGMLTAFSVEGFELFGDRMRAVASQASNPNERLTAIGVEYLRFAIEERAYFEVMFRAEMHNRQDPGLAEASGSAYRVLAGIAAELAEGEPSESRDTGSDSSEPGSRESELRKDESVMLALRAWTMVHGLATLWLDGALSAMWDGDDVYALALRIFESDLR